MSKCLKFICICFLATTLTGCDFLESIKNSFSKKKTSSSSISPSQNSVKTPQPLTGTVLARVGKWTITQNEFEERLKALKEIVPDYDVVDPQARKLVLDELIRQQLIVMDAESTGLANQKDIVAAVDEFRRTLLVREAARKITENVVVNEQEARDFYQENQEQIIQPFQYRVSEIVVADEVKANEIYVELLKGGNFAESARSHSISESATAGGDLGFLTEDPFEAMVEAVLALKEGGISKVFEGPDGFYIVRLDEKKGGEQIPFMDVKEDIIRNRTLFKQQQAILNYINGLRTRMNVEVNEKLLQ